MLAFFAMLLAVVLVASLASSGGQTLSYSDFLGRVDSGSVKAVTIDGDGGVDGTLTHGTSFVTQLPTALNVTGLDQRLQAKNIQITAKKATGNGWGPCWVACFRSCFSAHCSSGSPGGRSTRSAEESVVPVHSAAPRRE
ncbi:ATP-dependent metallopeptidase FtsH/Yme1/Tma family protein [Rhodococcus sp. JVH1]|uniref:ATP-dependent metallopeptidase FtsH/Yme1/Tma family protein n=1 Tax=Rhodococcus sp. JVH1 TaxID=745408 RepID=UPI00027211E8|nr:ATP-dependent metallopeptidase FtsH/Yme1/Tma family protein [Rhodococcus sp. JVH1]EJJ02123.1 ATP-dependent metalloprotease FtsH [Rhodococcus sp. JVH1]